MTYLPNHAQQPYNRNRRQVPSNANIQGKKNIKIQHYGIDRRTSTVATKPRFSTIEKITEMELYTGGHALFRMKATIKCQPRSGKRTRVANMK